MYSHELVHELVPCVDTMLNQLLAALSLAAVHSSKCTGNSSSLPPSDCAFWHDFYNALGGGSWVYCNNRTDPGIP